MANVVLKLGDDISTDIIYPGRFMATVLPTETPQYAFADIPEFNTPLKKGEIPAGSVIVAGKNFGCGSSREQAASCLKGPDLVVIARHFARIFLQNSMFQFVISVLGVLIFAGLTAWDTQKLKEQYDYVAGDATVMAKASIMGALTLYLDFINMFQFLLAIFGNRNSE